MEKAILILTSTRYDKSSWSGTNYSLDSFLSKYFTIVYEKYELQNLGIFYRFFKKINLIFAKVVLKHNINYTPIWYLRIQTKKFLKRIKEKDCKLIITTVCNLIPFISKDYFVIYITDAVYKSMIGYYWFNIPKNIIDYHNNIQNLAIQRSNIISVSSEWAKNECLKYYPNNNIISVNYYGPNCSKIKPSKTHKNNNEIHLLFCGVDKIRKGLNKAIEIVETVNKIDNLSTYILDVIGISGSNTDLVKYHGKLYKDNESDFNIFNELFNNAFILILPTVAECSAIVFSEAAMYKIPVMTNNTGGTSSYVKNNINGFLFNVNDSSSICADKIYLLKTNHNIYNEMKKAQYTLSKTSYNWDVWSRNIYDLLNKHFFKL